MSGHSQISSQHTHTDYRMTSCHAPKVEPTGRRLSNSRTSEPRGPIPFPSSVPPRAVSPLDLEVPLQICVEPNRAPLLWSDDAQRSLACMGQSPPAAVSWPRASSWGGHSARPTPVTTKRNPWESIFAVIGTDGMTLWPFLMRKMCQAAPLRFHAASALRATGHSHLAAPSESYNLTCHAGQM
jgi:hypothetical protein